MELTTREIVTCIHGILFGGFFLMSIFGSIVMLVEWRRGAPAPGPAPSGREAAYLVATVLLGWAAVLTGAYLVYPWYRAVAPAGADLAGYPQRLLLSHPNTSGWHSLGMEWKEHVAWFAPIVMTMVAYVLLRHRAAWDASRSIRSSVLGFAAVAFLAAALAGGWGAMINKAAPVRGGNTIHILENAK